MIEIIPIKKDKPIEIYCVPDLHLDNSQYNTHATLEGLKQLAKDVKCKKANSEKIYVLCFLGDIIEPTVNLERIIPILKELSNVFDYIFEVKGNHDLFSITKLLNNPNVMNIESVIIDFGRIELVGYSPKIFSEDIEKLKQHIKMSVKSKKVVIIVSHFPPYGILDYGEVNGKGNNLKQKKFSHLGDKVLANIVNEINGGLVVVCGHVSREGGKERPRGLNLVVNAGEFGLKYGKEFNSFLTVKIEWDNKEKILHRPQFQHPCFNFSSEEEFLDFLFSRKNSR
jgi:Icc-related predicted phosphoesterase